MQSSRGMELCLGTSGLEGLLGSVLSVTLVADELGVDATERGVLVGLGLLDTVTVSLAHLVVLGGVLGLGPVDGRKRASWKIEVRERRKSVVVVVGVRW